MGLRTKRPSEEPRSRAMDHLPLGTKRPLEPESPQASGAGPATHSVTIVDEVLPLHEDGPGATAGNVERQGSRRSRRPARPSIGGGGAAVESCHLCIEDQVGADDPPAATPSVVAAGGITAPKGTGARWPGGSSRERARCLRARTMANHAPEPHGLSLRL